MRNHLIPEGRTNKNGDVVIRYVKPFEQTNTSQRYTLPAPTPSNGGRVQNQGVFEKLVNSVLEFLLGPSEQDSAKDAEAREVLRERISELPQRTLKYAKDTWKEMEARADDGLDKTQFGHFSEKVRADVKTLLENDANGPRLTEDIARDFETIIKIAKVQAQKFKSRAEARTADWGNADERPISSAFLSGYQHYTGPPQRYTFDPQPRTVPEDEFVHEGTIHDSRPFPTEFPPMPDYRPQSYYHRSGVDTLNDILSGPRDTVDPMLGGNGG
jgi:hypothetical protein